ncbi:hypothetical protein L1987_64121 [Smallanthus sonchifolius]|uniref:Uncharacterized protein n=1 Tax=Smallanthus sonchifolius TaxID=185202 RepID=A0ACB9CF44_9ASTR|nr:hypothetical protein L1987_64121 [Smallanthus sonchifolius]
MMEAEVGGGGDGGWCPLVNGGSQLSVAGVGVGGGGGQVSAEVGGRGDGGWCRCSKRCWRRTVVGRGHGDWWRRRWVVAVVDGVENGRRWSGVAPTTAAMVGGGGQFSAMVGGGGDGR